MKNILLASTALVAFAGAAFAEGHTGISFSGSADLGYNDEAGGDNKFGFYSDLDISAGFAAELDNGLTAAASLNLDNLDSGNTDDGKDYSLSLSSETAGLFYGDTDFAAQTHWTGAGDMESDGFSEADGDVALRGDVKVGTVDASISYALIDSDNVTNTLDDLTQLSIGASTDLGNVNVKMAYQENTNEGGYTNGDFNKNDVFGLSLGTSFAGADVRLAYAEDNNSDSTGLKVAYPFGPVTATAYVVSESVGKDNTGINLSYSSGPLAVALDIQDDQGTSLTGLEGSYDIGNGIMAYAGYLTKDAKDDRFYVAGTYDLGSGASLGMSYAEDKDDVDGDETGAGDYQQGTTVEVSFKF